LFWIFHHGQAQFALATPFNPNNSPLPFELGKAWRIYGVIVIGRHNHEAGWLAGSVLDDRYKIVASLLVVAEIAAFVCIGELSQVRFKPDCRVQIR
jgi:hypothetical protein